MQDTWDILVRELAVFGIRLVGGGNCQFLYNGKLVTAPLQKKISLTRKEMKNNEELFADLWQDALVLLQQPATTAESPVDDKLARLFSQSLKGLHEFSDYFVKDFHCLKKGVDEEELVETLRASLDKDINDFAKAVVSGIPDYWIAIEWVWRRISRQHYLCTILKFAMRGRNYVSQKRLVEAAGVSGPWSNLNLPMKEREFQWSEIEEEMQGKQKDIRNQRRYRMGLENYNNDGRVGEGFYWREIRNEPYLWSDRSTESPYAGRSLLNRG